jgi:hypothetical protein
MHREQIRPGCLRKLTSLLSQERIDLVKGTVPKHRNGDRTKLLRGRDNPIHRNLLSLCPNRNAQSSSRMSPLPRSPAGAKEAGCSRSIQHRAMKLIQPSAQKSRHFRCHIGAIRGHYLRNLVIEYPWQAVKYPSNLVNGNRRSANYCNGILRMSRVMSPAAERQVFTGQQTHRSIRPSIDQSLSFLVIAASNNHQHVSSRCLQR